MNSTDNELNETEKSTIVAPRKRRNGKVTGGGTLKLTKNDAVFLGTLIVESARMIGVRDSFPDPSICRSTSKLVEKFYEDYMNGND
jgi:hypothetical protein